MCLPSITQDYPFETAGVGRASEFSLQVSCAWACFPVPLVWCSGWCFKALTSYLVYSFPNYVEQLAVWLTFSPNFNGMCFQRATLKLICLPNLMQLKSLFFEINSGGALMCSLLACWLGVTGFDDWPHFWGEIFPVVVTGHTGEHDFCESWMSFWFDNEAVVN